MGAPDRPILLVSHEYRPFRGGVATYVREVGIAAQRVGLAVEVWTGDYKDRGKMVEDCKANVNESLLEPRVVRLSSSGRLTPGGLLSFVWGLWRRRAGWRKQPVILLSVGAQMAFFLL